MSVIQKIRDKYATLMIVTICVSLVAFLLMDALVGPRSFFQHSNMVAKINGEEIDYKDFIDRQQIAESMARQQRPDLTEEDRQQIRERVWNDLLSEVILGEEYDKLGIQVTNDEIVDQAATPDADPQIKAIPAFTDPQTGQFDPGRVAQFIRSLDQDQTGRSRQMWEQIKEYLQKSIPQKKFYTLVRQAVYYPKWLAEAELKDKSTSADINYLAVPYTTIPDSTVKVTDSELQQYLDDHKALFHQEASRSVEYISFDAIPTAADTASLLKTMDELKSDLSKTTSTDLAGFVNRNSDVPYFDGYTPVSQLRFPQKDSVVGLPVGGIFGPYIDNGNYTLARMVDKRSIPDTVKVRHILISTQQVPDSVARGRIDSIVTAIHGGADFAAMVEQYSDDPGSKQTAGEYTFSATQIQSPNFTPEFRQFILYDGKKGDKKIVKGELGYFYIEILDQKNFSPAVKVAYLSKHIDPSQQTDNETFGAASEFAGNHRTRDAFEKGIQSAKLNKRVADNILATDYIVPGIGQARSLVQWAFNDAKLGEVSSVFTFDNKNVVAVLTGIRKEGTASLEEVRPQIAAEVRRQHKGKEIAGKIGNPASLEAASSKLGVEIQQAQHVNFTAPYMPGAGFEPKVVGAVFNPALGKNKLSAPVAGNNGVYLFKIDSVSTEPQTEDIKTVQANQEMTTQTNIVSQLFDMLKKTSDVDDRRIKFQ